jgi:hypothetical protein
MKLAATLFAVVLISVNGISSPAQSSNGGGGKAQLNKLNSQRMLAQMDFERTHKAAARRRYILLTVELATATMNSKAVEANTRYPLALGLFQDALKLDPTNQQANKDAKKIDGIYRGLILKARQTLKVNRGDPAATAHLARYMAVYRKLQRPLP